MPFSTVLKLPATRESILPALNILPGERNPLTSFMMPVLSEPKTLTTGARKRSALKNPNNCAVNLPMPLALSTSPKMEASHFRADLVVSKTDPSPSAKP